MQLHIRHATQYRYDRPVDYALQKLRLRPLPSVLQTVPNWAVDVIGGKIEVSYKDHYGNHVDLVSADPGAEALTITAHGVVETIDSAGVLGPVYGRAPLWHFKEPTRLTKPGPASQTLSEIVAGDDVKVEAFHALSAAIIERAPYEIGKTNARTTAEQALDIGFGVCQDHANIFITAARFAGHPARYVSGYLMMSDRIDQDASHAWAEVHLDGLGWVAFDVSNGYSPDERYVRLAIGRDASDAAPISGLRMGSAGESMAVTLQVQQ